MDEDFPEGLNIILFNMYKWAESPQLLRRASGILFHMKQPSAGAREPAKDEEIGGLFGEARKQTVGQAGSQKTLWADSPPAKP